MGQFSITRNVALYLTNEQNIVMVFKLLFFSIATSLVGGGTETEHCKKVPSNVDNIKTHNPRQNREKPPRQVHFKAGRRESRSECRKSKEVPEVDYCARHSEDSSSDDKIVWCGCIRSNRVKIACISAIATITTTTITATVTLLITLLE